MSKPAFIIDGFTEKLVIQKICPGSPISRIDLNGKTVSIDAMTKKIASLIRLFCNRYYPIIILIDKEQRRQHFDVIAMELEKKLIAEGIKDEFLIGVADRMFENWILADWNCLQVVEKRPSKTEGGNGAGHIKKVKGSYNKTTDGVELFLSANPEIIYEKSESFRYFVNKLKKVECKFLKFLK
jgi:hypothetical protein